MKIALIYGGKSCEHDISVIGCLFSRNKERGMERNRQRRSPDR